MTMNQVLHIFRKDVRHHWPEIAASLALLAAFARFDIRSWGQPYGGTAYGMASGISVFLGAQMLPGLVNFLLPVSWIFLIVRVVQGESLVGDRQFWITRPYDWKQLLATKALFVLTFVNLPFLLADAFLLAYAGFHPTHYVVGLLWLQLMWILFLFVWLTALATVTSSIAQMLLALLLIVLDIIGTSALTSIIHKSELSGDVNLSWGLVVIGVAVIVILMQYSRRRTALSRWLIVGLCALLTLISVASSRATPDRSSILRRYPLSTGKQPVELGLMPPDTHEDRFAPFYNDEVSIHLPLSVAEIPEDSFLQLDGMIVTLTNAKGFRWDSGWKGNSESLFPQQKTAQLGFQIKQSAFDQLRSGPVTANFLLAFTLYRDKNRHQFVVPGGKFTLPEVGFCTTELPELRYSRSIHCLAPLRRPAFLLVTSDSTTSGCPSGGAETEPPPGTSLHAFVRGASEPAEMGISSVRPVNIHLSDWEPSLGRVVATGICPGTPLILSTPQEDGRSGMELQFDNLSLVDYQARSRKGVR